MLDVGEAATGRLIDKLCDEGLLERRADPADRRSHRIYLKPAAEAVLQKLIVLGEAQESRAFTGLSPQELETFNDLLDRIVNNLSKAEHDVPTK